MSFVSIIGTKDFITVMSDGLVVDRKDDSKILDTRYKKFHLIAPKQFIAFTGNQGIAEKVKGILKYNPNGYNMYSTIVELGNQILKEVPLEIIINLTIGGINEKGEVEFHKFVKKQGSNIQSFKPINDAICYDFMGSPYITPKIQDNLKVQFQKLIKINGFNTPNKVLKTQKKMNDLVSEIDPTVNKAIFEQSFKKR
ncbi:hypothetical protein [Viridibacillus sp. FSL H8-0123]|uniref:hypothetical protein n=1 Tax=Viridibacillus sp. FSL H8-0123 TaxID=1928922 RepID=UPI00096EAFD6|nr:hypothetical protein [Viridibacillus sp. FSL H8-0123]OMC83350.1 hypothetical protein BK130_07320 [Viridibacillus sp. FSL H8-0123]